ncbi:MAG: tyrosine-type recombinase/integrase [bacterium]|nr:tyrosine-type recombinase/integrase [bacterium]
MITQNEFKTTEIQAARQTALAITDTARLVEAFLSGRNERTLRAYNGDLRDFAKFADAADVPTAAALLLGRGHGSANALALFYRSGLFDRGFAPATINRRLAALRALVKMARTLGFVTWSLEVESVKARSYRDTRGPGPRGVRAILGTLDGDTRPKALRDRAVLRLLYDCGLRRGEVVGLDVGDLDLEGDRVFVLGKGRTGREPVTLPAPTTEALTAWLTAHPTGEGPLFVNFDRAGKGSRLTGRSVGRLVAALGARVGLEVRPHGLRHTAITEALEATGGDVRRVARFSRHADIRVLSLYDDNREDLGGEVARLVAAAV